MLLLSSLLLLSLLLLLRQLGLSRKYGEWRATECLNFFLLIQCIIWLSCNLRLMKKILVIQLMRQLLLSWNQLASQWIFSYQEEFTWKTHQSAHQLQKVFLLQCIIVKLLSGPISSPHANVFITCYHLKDNVHRGSTVCFCLLWDSLIGWADLGPQRIMVNDGFLNSVCWAVRAPNLKTSQKKAG